MRNSLGMRLFVMFSVITSAAISTRSQDFPRTEIFGGFSYLNFQLPNGLSSVTAPGWEASASVNVKPWLGIEGDLSAHYGTNCAVSGLSCKDLSFMGGPRISYREENVTLYVHGLFGADNGSFGAGGISRSDTPFAFAAGGGFDYKINSTVSIRIVQLDYFGTRHAHDLGIPMQNNFRESAGVVFTFGGNANKADNSQKAAKSSIGPVVESPLLGISGYQAERGFMVDSVRTKSPASTIGIEAGDVITRIDGQPVHTSSDIETALGTSATGTVDVIYLIQGTWQTEKQLKLR
jgi:hypothetical protein